MQIQPISDWQSHITAGRRYLQTATNGRSRPAVFNNALVFQLAAMAVEKLIVGMVQYHHQMPADHTLSGLAAGLTEVCPLDKALARRIRQIEVIDDMCSLSAEQRPSPAEKDIREILEVGHEVARFVDRHIPPNGGEAAAA